MKKFLLATVIIILSACSQKKTEEVYQEWAEMDSFHLNSLKPGHDPLANFPDKGTEPQQS